MVCDATYKKISENDDELEASVEQCGFKDEREYLKFLLEQEEVWEHDHPGELGSAGAGKA